MTSYGGTPIANLPANTTITSGFTLVATGTDGKTYQITIGEMMNDAGATGVSADADNALEEGSDGKPYLDAAALAGGEGLVTSVNGSTGAVVLTIAGLLGVPLSAFSAANTLLVGSGVGTYSALAIAEDRMPLRVTGESVKAGTAAEIRTFLNVTEGATGAMTGAEIAEALLTLSAADMRTFLAAVGSVISAQLMLYPDGEEAEAGDVLVAKTPETTGIFDVQRVAATETLTDPDTTYGTDSTGEVVARTNADQWLATEDASPYEEQATVITANVISVDAATGRKWRTGAPAANFEFADACWENINDQMSPVIVTVPSGATGYIATAANDAITVKTINVPAGILTANKDAIFWLYYLGTTPILHYLGVTG